MAQAAARLIFQRSRASSLNRRLAVPNRSSSAATACSVSLHFMYYNFARPHVSLQGQTPAMAAGVADHVWTLEEILSLVEADESSHNSN